MATNLASDPLPPTAKEAAPERFICDSVVESISNCLGDLDEIIRQTHGSVGKTQRVKNQEHVKIHVSDEPVLLSFRDARLFMIALCRLPKKEQKKVLSKIAHLTGEDLPFRFAQCVFEQ